MLSTAKMGTGSWPYYAAQVGKGACEYFLGVGEAPGRWHGRGIDRLDLVDRGVVSEAQLEGLFGRARHPETGELLGQAWRADGVTGFDLCFSAPKSVSALWALGDDAVASAVRTAHGAAVRAALDYLDMHAAFSRVGRYGHTQVRTAGLAAAVFDHRTSRAGDPQLHSHALVLNKALCVDGGWRALDGAELYGHKKAAGTVYQAALRSELTRRLGVAWTAVSEHGQAEITGVPTVLLECWSTRAAQVAGEAGPVIAAYEQTLGRPLTSAERTAVAKVAVLKTRPSKEHLDVQTLRERWSAQAADLGWTGDQVRAALRAAAAATPALDRGAIADGIDSVLEAAVTAAGARRAIFSRADLTAQIAARVPVDGFSADMVREIVERLTDRALPLAVRLRDDDTGVCARASDARYASVATLDAEQRILARARVGQRAGHAVLETGSVARHTATAGLDRGQTIAIGRITRDGDLISVLVAPAGTGKTTAIGAAARAWQQAGYRILGLAPSARAAAELTTATGTTADTVAKYLHEHHRTDWSDEHRAERWADPTPATPFRLDRRTVVLLDEASMLATADLDVLTQHAVYAGAKLVLIGDPAQLGTIDRAGGMLAALAHQLHAPSLETVHRFHEPWEAHASLQLRDGDADAITAYLEHGRIHPARDGDSARDAVIQQWADATEQGQHALMLASSHRDVDALNTAAREHLEQAGVIHGPVLVDGPMPWRAGDRLRATRNDRRLTVGDGHVRNGDVFTVLGAAPRGTDGRGVSGDRCGDGGGLLVEHRDTGRCMALPAAYVREHARYGWASTITTAQGATVDVGILVARPGIDREHLYVGLTRGRHANHVHLAPTEIGEPHHLPGPPSVTDGLGRAETQLRDALATTGAEHAAHTRLRAERASVCESAWHVGTRTDTAGSVPSPCASPLADRGRSLGR